MKYKKPLAILVALVFSFQILVVPTAQGASRDIIVAPTPRETRTFDPVTTVTPIRGTPLIVNPITPPISRVTPLPEKLLIPEIVPTVDLRSASSIYKPLEYQTTLEVAAKQGQPLGVLSGNNYGSKDGIFINWNRPDLKWWFRWKSTSPKIASIVWQVSTAKFAPDPDHWENPIGLVASGRLNSDQNEFSINFAACGDTPQKWSQQYSQNITIPYIKNVLSTNKNTLLTKQNQVTYNKIIANSSQLIAKNKDLLSVLRATEPSKINAKVQEISKGLLTQMSATQKKTYYIRVVPLDVSGQCLELPSAQREVIYGEPGHSLAKANTVPLKSTYFGDKQTEVERYGIIKELYFDWNRNPALCYFETVSTIEAKEGFVQVSALPFNQSNSGNWKNPDGLLYQSGLQSLVKGKKSLVDFKVNMALFAPKKYTDKPISFPYYVRTVFIEDNKNEAGVETVSFSNTIKVLYGKFEGDKTETIIYPPVKVPIYSPVISLKEYQPFHSQDSKWNFRFVVVKEPPAFLAGIYGHVGTKVDLSPKPEDKDIIDYIEDGINAAVGFVGSLVNWASQTMAKLEDLAATLIVSLIPGQPEWLKSIVLAGIQAGLVSLGIPPTLPTSDQLMNVGVDYLAETLAQQAGVPAEIAKQGVKAMADQAKSSGSMGGTLDFLKLDPDYQYRNAYLMLDLYNPDYLNSTMNGSINVTVQDITPEFKEKHWYYGDDIYRTVNMPIPSIKPRQHLQVPVIFTEDDSIPVAEAWLPYYSKGTSEFKVDYYSIRPDIKELSKQLGVNPGLIEFSDKYGKPVTVQLRPNKPWSKLYTSASAQNH